MAEFQPNTLYYVDNLEVLPDFPPECVDLVYLDPPFNSNRSYNVIFREAAGTEAEAQIEAFGDTWHWTPTTAVVFDEVAGRGDDTGRLLQAFVDALGHNDMTAYLTMMAPRLLELRRVMKPTASIYLHCDPTASHYLKALMDSVFGARNFINEIVWSYRTGGSGKHTFSKKHDVLLFYSQGRRYTFNQQKEKAYTKAKGRRPGVHNYGAGTAEFFEDEDGVYNFVNMRDVWEIPYINSQSKERLGYPTQKPEALLERIIEASSNPGDLVLDPFCGCGTATVAAHRLGRQWVGIDITWLAVDLMQNRLRDTFPDDFGDGVPVDGEPADEAAALALAERSKFQFQYWAVAKLGGVPRGGSNRKGPDQGIDGVTTFPERDPDDPASPTLQHRQVIISVKGGGTGVADVRDLRGVIEREGAAIGVLATARTPTRAMVNEANAAGVYRSPWDGSTYPRIQLVTAGDIVHGKGIEMPSRRGMPQYQQAPRATEQADQGELI